MSDKRLRGTVHEVRAALEAGQDSPDYLETMPGRGYRFVAPDKTIALHDGRPHTTCARGQCVMHFGAGEAYAPVLEALGRLGHEGFGYDLIRVIERVAPMQRR